MSKQTEGSLESLQKMHPGEIFEGRVKTRADPDNDIEMELIPSPTACGVCAGKPVVSFRTGAILPGAAYGFCEQHKSAWGIESKEIKGKTYHWFKL